MNTEREGILVDALALAGMTVVIASYIIRRILGRA